MASPTTSMSACSERIVATPSRTTLSSSTTRIRTFFMLSSVPGWCYRLVSCHRYHDFGPFIRFGQDLELALDLCRSLAHIGQSQAGPVHLLRVKTAAVILDFKYNILAPLL